MCTRFLLEPACCSCSCGVCSLTLSLRRVEVNEELDLEVVIRQLKRENALLRQELQLLRSGGVGNGGSSSGSGCSGDSEEGAAAGGGLEQRTQLTEAEKHVLRRQVQAFVEDPSPDALLGVEPSMLFIRAAFDLLKGMARGAAPAGPALAGGAAAAGPATDAELRSLRQLVQRQEQQIKVLSGVLRKQGVQDAGAEVNAHSDLPSRPMSSSSARSSGCGSAQAGWQGPAQQQQQAQRPSTSATAAPPAVPYSDALLSDQHKAVSAQGCLFEPALRWLQRRGCNAFWFPQHHARWA